MRYPCFRRSLVVLASGLALVATGSAQAVRTLLPDRHELSAGSSVDLRLAEEAGGERTTAAWPAERIRWFFVRVAGTQENFDAYTPLRKGLDFARVRVAHAGIALVGLDLRPRIEEVPAKELTEFLAKRVGPRTLPVGWRWTMERETVRVRRFESTKLLLRSVDEKGWLPSSADAQGKSGQRVEIRPLADPTAVRVNRVLPVRIYLPPGGSDGARVIARHVPSGRVQTFLTRPGGTGHFTVDAAGLWTIETHHARPLLNDEEADWEIHTATLSFEVPPVPDEEGEGR